MDIITGTFSLLFVFFFLFFFPSSSSFFFFFLFSPFLFSNCKNEKASCSGGRERVGHCRSHRRHCRHCPNCPQLGLGSLRDWRGQVSPPHACHPPGVAPPPPQTPTPTPSCTCVRAPTGSPVPVDGAPCQWMVSQTAAGTVAAHPYRVLARAHGGGVFGAESAPTVPHY